MINAIRSLVGLAMLAVFFGHAAPSHAQSVVIEIPGQSADWYNSYAKPKPPIHRPKPKPPVAGAPEKPVLGVKRPYHRGYYGRYKPRRHVYTRPRRNVRGYSNAPWN